MQIIFIEPKNSHLHIYSKFNLPRIGCTLLATILAQQGHDTSVYFMTQMEVEQLSLHPDLVAISTITPTALAGYAIADRFRALNIPVIIGGPHASALPEEALSHADYVLTGEAEFSLPQFVSILTQKKGDFHNIPGLYWKEADRIRHNLPGELIRDLDQLPYPDYSLLHRRKPVWG